MDNKILYGILLLRQEKNEKPAQPSKNGYPEKKAVTRLLLRVIMMIMFFVLSKMSYFQKNFLAYQYCNTTKLPAVSVKK
jgi:hypothetical protein